MTLSLSTHRCVVMAGMALTLGWGSGGSGRIRRSFPNGRSRTELFLLMESTGALQWDKDIFPSLGISSSLLNRFL